MNEKSNKILSNNCRKYIRSNENKKRVSKKMIKMNPKKEQ